MEIKGLEKLSVEELKELRAEIAGGTSIEELLLVLDTAIEGRKPNPNLNARFPIEWMTIDSSAKKVLLNNGIKTEQDLLETRNLQNLPGMTGSDYEQIVWARIFFNMEPNRVVEEQKRDSSTSTKSNY